MDLQIKDRTAMVCASSKGLGYACALALAEEGVKVFINGRDQDRLDAAKASIKEISGQSVSTICADVGTEDGRAAIMTACPDADILINNNGGPPPGKFLDWDEQDWADAINANMVPALMLIRQYLPGMQSRKFGRIINITSAMVKSPRMAMGLSTGARTGLTAVCKALSVEVASDNVTINAMLPERFDTDRQVNFAHRQAKREGYSYEDARTAIAASLAANRFGRPEEFGKTCAFLCSAHAGFISGQNVQLDGGSYKGLI